MDNVDNLIPKDFAENHKTVFSNMKKKDNIKFMTSFLSFQHIYIYIYLL